MSITGKNRLDPTKAPTLPFAPVQYDRGYTDTKNNYLRQYFNTIDNATSQLFSNLGGGRFLTFPHIAAQDSGNQYATATDTPTLIAWDTLDTSIAFTLNPSGTATPEHTGVYKIDYSLQFLNTDTQIKEAYVWLQIDGVDLPGSASTFSVASSHGGVPGALVAYSSITFEITGGCEIGLWWATNQAYDPVGPVDGIYMAGTPAQTSPFAMPSNPSAIGSIVFVSGVA